MTVACTGEDDISRRGRLKFNRDGKIFCTINMGKEMTEVQVPAGSELFFKSKNAKQTDAAVQLPQYGFAAVKIK